MLCYVRLGYVMLCGTIKRHPPPSFCHEDINQTQHLHESPLNVVVKGRAGCCTGPRGIQKAALG